MEEPKAVPDMMPLRHFQPQMWSHRTTSPAHVLPREPQAPAQHRCPKSPIDRKGDDKEEPTSENHSLEPQLRPRRGTTASTCVGPGGAASESLQKQFKQPIIAKPFPHRPALPGAAPSVRPQPLVLSRPRLLAPAHARPGTEPVCKHRDAEPVPSPSAAASAATSVGFMSDGFPPKQLRWVCCAPQRCKWPKCPPREPSQGQEPPQPPPGKLPPRA